jgi:hypothetical protein
MSNRYGAWCEVWGGVTGPHEAWLQSKGKAILFDSIEQAEAEATRLMGDMSDRSRYTEARFRYTGRVFTK